MENKEQKKKTIVLLQEWSAGKLSIGDSYDLKDSNRTMTLIEDEEYPKGKFVFDDGEIFDPAKYFDSFFIDKNISKEKEETSVYDEKFWDELDNVLNENNNGIIRNTFVEPQKNEQYIDRIFYDVTEVVNKMIEDGENTLSKGNIKSEKDHLRFLKYGYYINNGYPMFTKDKFIDMFHDYRFEPAGSDLFKIYKNDRFKGYLSCVDGKFIYVPIINELRDEYSYNNDQFEGFYYTGDSYLDIVLSTIEKYKKEFVTVYNYKKDKNNSSFGYQADATIKTLLAFSCECYLKSLLIQEGKNLNELKEIGHGLSVLFTSLDDDDIGYIFDFIEKNRHKNYKTSVYYDTNDYTEKFMLDLANVDSAFIEARYSAENDKNTDYDFLYNLAMAIRNRIKNKYYLQSPFDKSILSHLSK